MSQEDHDRDRQAHFSFFGASSGAVIGSGIGSLLGPELAAVGAILGGTAGGSASYSIAGSELWERVVGQHASPEELIAAKVTRDFRHSVLHDHSLMTRVRVDSHRRVLLLQEHRKRDFLRMTPERSARWIGRHLPAIQADAVLSDRSPDALARAEALRRTNKQLRANCECIEPACVAVLKSLRHPDRFGLPLKIDYQDTSGVYQVNKVGSAGGRFDFLITANAPFFLLGAKTAAGRDYRLNFEVHGEEQVLLRRRSLKRPVDPARVHVFADSSAEEQFLLKHGVPESAEQYSHRYFEVLKEVIASLEPGELVIAWEPLATVLSSSKWVARTDETPFLNWISLFSHKRWLGKTLRQAHKDFRYLFIYEWLYCLKNPDWALGLVLDDKALIDRFALGAGLRADPLALVGSEE